MSKIGRKAKYFRKRLLKRATPSEREFEKKLKKANIVYKKQHIIFVSYWKFYIVDFFIPDLQYVVEIDGWIHKKQKQADAYRTKLLLTKVEKVVRIKNEDINKFNIQCLKQNQC